MDNKNEVRHVVTISSLNDPNWPEGHQEPYYVVSKPEHVTALALIGRPMVMSDLDDHCYEDVAEFTDQLHLEPGALVWVLPARILPDIVNDWKLERLI